jgi:TonB family protein
MVNVAAGAAASGASYVWEDPGDSMMIQVSLDLIERLGEAIRQGLGRGPRGIEIGGILLGRTVPGFGRAVQIEDFEVAPCEHVRGASYTLSPREMRALGTRLARRPARQVVGYFRSHTRPGMYLDQDDLAVFSRYFPDAWQAFLLVRPSKEGAGTGGFFFWEDGEINRRSTYRQFPFDATRLMAGNFPIIGEQRAAIAGPRLAPPIARKPEARAGYRLPPLPWVVVPVIAVLFLIAGLFVSEKEVPPRETAAMQASPPIIPLLPEPVPQAAGGSLVSSATQEIATQAVEPVKPSPLATSPKTSPHGTAAKMQLPNAVASPPAVAAHVPSREVEPPPALPVPVARLEPKVPAVLPARAAVAPPLEVEVTYETPHAGVFRRAIHKIEGAGDVPASPIRKVLPARRAEAGAVDVKVFIDETGHVSRAQVLSKGGDLTAAALSAALQWQFTPARRHDKPVPGEMLLHFR